MGSHAQHRSLRANGDFRDIVQCDRHIALHPDHCTAYAVNVVCREKSTYNVLITILIQDTAGRVAVHGFSSGDDLLERDVVMLHLLRRQLYLILFYVSSDDRDLGHAAKRKKSRTEGPVGQCPEVLH